MKIKLLLILFFVFSLNYSQKDSTQIKVLKIIETISSNNTMQNVIENYFKIQENQYPRLKKAAYWKEFKDHGIDYDKLTQMLVPIYKSNFTEKEIEDISAFYFSTSGQALVEKMPKISKESSEARAEWSKEVFDLIQTKVYKPLIDKYEAPIKKCENLKSGRFRYFDEDKKEVIVLRDDNIQEEIKGGKINKVNVEWLDKCRYKVWKTEKKKDDDPIVTIVSIYELNNKKYKYISRIEDTNQYFEGEMMIISEE